MRGRTNLKSWRAILVVLAGLSLCATAKGRTIHVDNDGPADFNNIQAAINDANDGDTVLVADGTYTGNGNQDIDFLGKAITVHSESGPENCIIDCNGSEEQPHRGFYFHSDEDANSVLDGFTITNGYASSGGGISCVNSSPRITNCIITDNFGDSNGGGIYSRYSNPIITDCTICGNMADRFGGGICGLNGSPTLINCNIIGNYSSRNGGGIHGCGPIINCTISGNSSSERGGGLIGCGPINNCTITGNTGGGLAECGDINNCTISGNTDGGLSACGATSNCTISGNTEFGVGLSGPISNCIISGNSGWGLAGCGLVDNCTIIGNTGGGLCTCYYVNNCTIVANSSMFGGGVYTCSTLVNCTIANNMASEDGGGIYCWGNETTVTNCILWGNAATRGDEIALSGYTMCPSGIGCTFNPALITVSYSNIQGGPTEVYIDSDCVLNWQAGNVDVDPNFAVTSLPDANECDYHLQSQAGRWDPNSQGWVQDDVTSPCIDAGDMSSPIGLEPFPNGGIINMGAYGGTAEASKSYFGEHVCETIVAGDINGDCKINLKDFQLMALHWLQD